MALAPLRVQESPQTAALSVTHAPIGKGGKNWITRSAPGNTGQLPAYIQNVRNGIMKHGKSESEATQLAIGVVRNWASGKGNVSPEVRAAAAKAVAEFEALRAKSKVTEADAGVLAALLEDFHFDPSEMRNFRGEWIGHGNKGKLSQLPEIPLADLGGSVGPGKWSPGAGSAVNDILEGKIEDTEHAHREMHGDGSLGPYSKGREALHQTILTRLFQGKMTHPQEARAIFTAGGPASGKSQMISKGHVDHPKDVVHVNPDIVKEMLPEYAELKKAGRTDASSLVHEEASHISKLAMAAALQHKHHVLVDTVGGGAPGKFAGKVKAAQAAGHHVSVHYTSISADEAVKRSEARAMREQAPTGKLGRRVPEGYLRSSHAEVSARFPEVQALPGVDKQVFDNNGKEIRLIAEQKAADDKIRIVDGRAYRAFLMKAKGR